LKRNIFKRVIPKKIISIRLIMLAPIATPSQPPILAEKTTSLNF